MAVTVDGVEIPEHEIQAEMARLRPGYGDYVQGQGGEPDEAQLREWAVENLIEELLFRREASATQPVPSDERVRQELETNAVAYADAPEAERLAKAREALQQRRLTREIRKGVRPPEETGMRAFYEAHPDLFVAPEALRLSHVCILPEPATRADDFLLLLRLKTDVEQGRMTWQEAVADYSDTAERDHGFFATVSRGELPAEVEEKLFALSPGGISDVVDFGERTLHLFKVLARLEPERVPFEEAREKLKSVLFEQACQDALNERFDALKAKAVIVR
jgi:hypothetical protein